MELRGEYDCNISEEMLAACSSPFGIMAGDMVSSNLSVKVVSFFPGFLEKPRSNIKLAHVVNNLLQFGKVRGCVN